MQIPKNIFQIWITTVNKKMPDEWINAQKTIIENNLNWNYYFITHDISLQILHKYFPDFISYYMNFEYDVQRADAIRYILMYLYGGIYIDLDYIAIKSFDSISLDTNKEIGFLQSAYINNHITNDFIISIPKSIFWLDCIIYMKRKKPFWAITRHLTVFNTTGPTILNKLIQYHSSKIQILKNIKNMCDKCNINKCKLNNDNNIIYPIEGKLWNTWDSHILHFLFCNKILIGIIIIIFIILKIIIKNTY